jgi:hypothetical protein
MKKIIPLIIALIFISLQLPAQKQKDALYLKNGSIIYGKLIEISENQYKIKTSDGSLFIYNNTEVEKYANESVAFDGRKKEGAGIALEAGFLVGAQSTDYHAPFSFNFLINYTYNTKIIFSAGSGVEFIGVPFTPLFVEYKYLIYERKSTPFIFARGGGLMHLGGGEETTDNYNQYNKTNYKGGFTGTLGTGISWAGDGIEPYLSFAYRYTTTSYHQLNYSNFDATFKSTYNRLEIKFGFKF